MREIEIRQVRVDKIIKSLCEHIGGTLIEQWGEYTLKFDNEIGKGTIRSITFDWGVSLIDYDVTFLEEVIIIYKNVEINPIEFIFISNGSIKYYPDVKENFINFDRYQNIIISSNKFSEKGLIFSERTNIKLNIIQVLKKEYIGKKNHNLSYLNNTLSSIFSEDTKNLPYRHLGNYSLKIADQIKKLNAYNHSGLIRTLFIEGQLNLIFAMQILEHNNFENKFILPESLSKDDIKKINKLSEYITDNISEPLTLVKLSFKSGISTKKLQLGFKVLYSKSVNEYIRELKLEIARDSLTNSELSVSEIVYEIGIKSRSYFSKLFFERYGILPTKYRRKMKKGNDNSI